MRVDRVIKDTIRSLRQVLQALDSNITAVDNLGPTGAPEGYVLTSVGPIRKPEWKEAAGGGGTGEAGPPGADGAPGAPGTPGIDGTDGSVWYTGPGAPSNSLGIDGDFYLDSSTGDFYKKIGGVFVLQGNLTGPAGEQGETGATGAPGQDGVSAGTFLVQGATIAWVSGFTFRIGAATYYLDGTLTTSVEQNVTLDAADLTYPRIDILVLDATGTATKLTGVPSSPPAEPTVDPSVYLRLGIVFINANVPAAEITQTPIWTEDTGTDWTAVQTGGHIVIASVNNPRTGTKCIEGTSVVSGDRIDFTIDSGSVDIATQDKHVFYIQVKAAWNTKKAIRIQWYASGVPVGQAVSVGNGLYGFNSQAPGSYQQIVIQSSTFAVPAGTAVTGYRWEITGSGPAVGFYLDDILLQAGISTAASSQFRWRGAWSATTSYLQNDAVSRLGITYIALTPTLGADPASSPTFWEDQGATKAYVDSHTGSVDPANIAGLQALIAASAPLLSPRFIGTPTKNGVALATLADIGGGGAVDPADIAGLRGLLASMAPLLSPDFIGTPTKNRVPLATTADIPAGGSVDPADISGLRALIAAMAPLLSPNFIGTPTKSGVALATMADIGGGGAVDPADVSGLRAMITAMAPLMSPNFIGTPKKNGVALATLSDISGSPVDSDQNILATQIFGA